MRQHAADICFQFRLAGIALVLDPGPDTLVLQFHALTLADGLFKMITGADNVCQERILHLAHLLAPVVVLLQRGHDLETGLVNLPGNCQAGFPHLDFGLLQAQGNLCQFLPDLCRHVMFILSPSGFHLC
jgi:hypothetical protein